ncbi:hypothetical protein Scep_002171 [Stephania cephalantha]|uniref:Uncharacterized protein n=1 Tax=Stephania cephalantha TaxID=152367 RepID=A0AAP0LC59_9MAGN
MDYLDATFHLAPRVTLSLAVSLLQSTCRIPTGLPTATPCISCLPGATWRAQIRPRIPAKATLRQLHTSSKEASSNPAMPRGGLLVRVCGNCGEYFHPTYACPYSKYRNHHGSTYASPQPNFYMSKRSPKIPQHEKRSIRDMMNDLIFRELTFQQSHQHERITIAERDMISDWLSQSTTQQPLQEDMQHMKSKLQNSETQVTAIIEHLMDEEELPTQPHLSEPEETLDVSSHEPDITIARYDDDEAEKEIEVISERPEEPQKENEEDQPLVLVKPPTLPCIFVRPCKGVEVKERSRIFYTADTFMLDDHDSMILFVLEVPNELRTRKRTCMLCIAQSYRCTILC